jgi:hypothetical protein
MDLLQCRKIFDRMDRNHLKEVNVRDLIVTLRRDPTISEYLHLGQKIRQESTGRTLQKIFNDIDSDHNHTISWNEFESYFLTHEFDEASKCFVPKKSTAYSNPTSQQYNQRSHGQSFPELHDQKQKEHSALRNNNATLQGTTTRPLLSATAARQSSNRPKAPVLTRLSGATPQLEDGTNGIADLRRELAQLHMEFATLQAEPNVPAFQHSAGQVSRPQQRQQQLQHPPSSYLPRASSPQSLTHLASSPIHPASPSATRVAVTATRVSSKSSPAPTPTSSYISTRSPLHSSRPEDLAQTKLYSRIQILEEHARVASEERAAANTMIKEMAGRVETAIQLVTDSIKKSSSRQHINQRVTKIENRLSILETSIIKEQETTLQSLELLLSLKDHRNL